MRDGRKTLEHTIDEERLRSPTKIVNAQVVTFRKNNKRIRITVD